MLVEAANLKLEPPEDPVQTKAWLLQSQEFWYRNLSFLEKDNMTDVFEVFMKKPLQTFLKISEFSLNICIVMLWVIYQNSLVQSALVVKVCLTSHYYSIQKTLYYI